MFCFGLKNKHDIQKVNRNSDDSNEKERWEKGGYT